MKGPAAFALLLALPSFAGASASRSVAPPVAAVLAAAALPKSAVALRAFPAAAASSPKAPAAVAQLDGAVRAAAGATPASPVESLSSAAAYDGNALAPDSGAEAAPALPAFLAAPDGPSSQWLAEVVAELGRSKTGAAVLRRVEENARRDGRPVVIHVLPLAAAHGLFNYDHGVITLDSKHMDADDDARAAGVLAHELQHKLQFDADLPSAAFEMELEGFLVQMRVYHELGYKPPRDSFEHGAILRFRNDVDRFVKWLNKEHYPDDVSFIGKTGGGYEEKLWKARRKAERGLHWFEARLKKVHAVLDRMRATLQPAPAVERYRLDDVAPLEAKAVRKRAEIAWLDRDIRIMSDPERRKRYERYAAKVLSEARKFQRAVR